MYAARLGEAPRHMLHDEMQFSLQAESIAADGRSLSGRRFPLYFAEPEFPAGRDPLVIYVTALVLEVLPLSEWSVRLPTALMGAANVGLMFVLASRVFGSGWIGLWAAVMLAMTPAHFMHSRMALSILYPVPFILVWLWCLDQFSRTAERRALTAGAAVLGLAVYSYLACVVMMPLYLLLTLLWLARRGQAYHAGRLTGIFALALVPILAWQVAHPDRYDQLMESYRLMGAASGEAAPAGAGLYEFARLRVGLFWSFFSPDYLFVTGDSSLPNSTRQAGYFAAALAVFIPVGIFQIARGRGGALGALVLAGLVTAPLAGVISGHLEMNRVLFAAPFGVLTAAYGVQALWQSTRPTIRWAALALLLAVPIQFWGFYADYVGPYQDRAATWFGGDIRGAVQAALDAKDEGADLIFVSRGIPYVERYWRFYAIARGRRDVVGSPVYFDPNTFRPADVAAPAVVVCRAGTDCVDLAGAPGWVERRRITETDGTPLYVVYQRRQGAAASAYAR